MEKLEWRDVFQKQPAYFLFLDVSPPMNLETLKNICSVLNDVIALTMSLKGSPRVSSIGIYILCGNAQCIFPMQSLKQNFSKFYVSLEGMRCLYSVSTCGGVCDTEKLAECLKDAVQQYEKFFQGSMLNKKEWPQLQITLLSSQTLQKFAKSVADILPDLQLAHIRKVQVIGIPVRGGDLFQWLEATEEDNSQGEVAPSSQPQRSSNECPTSNSDPSDDIRGLMEVTKLDNNIFQLEHFFKSWLHDGTNDSDHLRIQIEPDALVLRCDLHECMINPDALPASSQFNLSPDTGYTQLVMPNQAKACAAKVPVYFLEAVGVVPQAGICESVVYGLPILISSTHCWKMEWDELESNQHLFVAVNQHLMQRKLVLLVKRQLRQTSAPESLPQGFFAIFPSPQKGTMLVKSIGSKELLLPNVHMNAHIVDTSIPEDLRLQAQECLEKLKILTMYNPISFSSGLYTHLTSTLRKSRVPRVKNQKIPTNMVPPIRGPTNTVNPQPNVISGNICNRQKTPACEKAPAGGQVGLSMNEEDFDPKVIYGKAIETAASLMKRRFITQL